MCGNCVNCSSPLCSVIFHIVINKIAYSLSIRLSSSSYVAFHLSLQQGPIKFNRYYKIKFNQVVGCHAAKKYTTKLKNKVMVKKKKRFHVESAGSFHWGEVSDSSIYRLSKITRHPEILGCQCRNYKRFRRFIPLPSNIGTSSHLPTNFNLH